MCRDPQRLETTLFNTMRTVQDQQLTLLLTKVLHSHHIIHMNNVSSPTTAYDLLEDIDRGFVDEYVQHVKNEQHARRERIALGLGRPIPSEYVRRSKGALNKPLVRVAVQEKIRKLADDEDLSPSRVIREHAAIAFSSIKNFAETGEFGEIRYKNIEEMPDELVGAVKAIKQIPSAYGNRVEIVMHDKIPSLKILSELIGLVAPDKPALLSDYVGAEQDIKHLESTPAEEYANLLESGN